MKQNGTKWNITRWTSESRGVQEERFDQNAAVSVSTTLRCVKEFLLTGISMFIP
jgi:hypothetical protein